MALKDYTTPFWGDRPLPAGYSPTAIDLDILENRNRPESIVRNNAKQVYQADVICNATGWLFNTSNYSQQNQNYASAFKIVSQEERPFCIFAIPCFFGNINNTAAGYPNRHCAGIVEYFTDMPAFYYFVVQKGKGASLTAEYINSNDDGFIRTLFSIDTARFVLPEYPDMPLEVRSITSFGENRLGTTVAETFSITPSTNFGNLVGYLRNIQNQSNLNVYQPHNMFDDGMLASLTTYISHWTNDTSNSVIGDCDLFLLNEVSTVILSPQAGTSKPCGASVQSGAPIFTMSSFEEMVKYFQGLPYQADNDTPPPSDWSTDWDIYVKGAQKPDIYITMKSDKLDEWLEDNADNTMGLTKEDVKVEYRYRLYNLDVGGNMGTLPKYLSTYTFKKWLNDTYNENRDTSYSENVALNYPLIEGIAGGTEEGGVDEFDDFSIGKLYNYYAQLEFRIRYGEYKSTWCRYKIGVIGSPSVPDFTKMQNEGVQDDEWQDKSTVTLHYDEYPDGYNPYPDKPKPDMPEAGDTSPSPSINGTGLLSTTYKITESQAKALGRFLWGGNFFQQLKALNMSPIQNIVGLCYMPINVAGSTSVIVIGNVDTNINGDVIGTTTPLYNLGSVNIQGRYNSFLDYAPYTTAHIFLPFVGFKPIDPQVFTNKTLSVTYSYDIITGVCNAMLFANGIYIESHQGNCGIDIPLVASNRAEVMAGLVMSLAETALVPANPKSTFALDVLSGAGDVMNAASSFHSNRQGGYSPTCAWSETRECFIVLETPNAWFPSTYSHDYGRPCMTTYTIAQLSGFTVCDQTVDTSGISGATEEEKRKIREILTSGFYA